MSVRSGSKADLTLEAGNVRSCLSNRRGGAIRMLWNGDICVTIWLFSNSEKGVSGVLLLCLG
jgi:hypothetical protein